MSYFDMDGEDDGGVPNLHHYVTAIDTYVDAERLLAEGGALSVIIEKARQEAVESLAMLIRNNIDVNDLVVARERVGRYESLVRWIGEIQGEGERAMQDLREQDSEMLDIIVNEGEPEHKDD